MGSKTDFKRPHASKIRTLATQVPPEYFERSTGVFCQSCFLGLAHNMCGQYGVSDLAISNPDKMIGMCRSGFTARLTVSSHRAPDVLAVDSALYIASWLTPLSNNRDRHRAIPLCGRVGYDP